MTIVLHLPPLLHAGKFVAKGFLGFGGFLFAFGVGAYRHPEAPPELAKYPIWFYAFASIMFLALAIYL